MQAVSTLIRVKLAAFRSHLLDRRSTYLVRNLSMLMLLSLLIALSYLFFYRVVFSYVIVIEDIGILLIDRLVAVGFLVFFFLLIISSMVISLGALYRSRETEYLFSTPLPVTVMFTGKFIDIVVFSSWTILIMALPILTAYARVREFGALDYAIAGALILLPYVLAAGCIGTLLAILLRYLSKRISLVVLGMAGTCVIGGLLWLVVVFARPTQLQIQFTEDFRALNMFINNFHLNSNPYVPSYWFIQGLGALVERRFGQFALYSSALVSSALMLLGLLYVAVEHLYFPTWLSSLEQTQARSRSEATTPSLLTGFTFRTPSSQDQALLQKDILVFLRDPSQWSQLIILLVLIVLYFINLSFIPGDIGLEHWRTILFLMNLSICGLVMATLAVRFVFPSISLEGDSFWVLGSSPVSTRTLFKEKFISAFIAFFIVAESIGVASVWLLALEDIYRMVTFVVVFLMSITLSSIAVGFGAAFPDFTERNPSKIVSSPGGVMTLSVSLVYVAAMLALAGYPIDRYTTALVTGEAFHMQTLYLAGAGMVALNALLIVLPLILGARTFTRREF